MPSTDQNEDRSWIDTLLHAATRLLRLPSTAGTEPLRSFLGVIIASSIAAALSFLSRIVIQLVLQPEEVGRFALLTTLFTLFAVAALWGQGAAMLRVYTKAPPGSYDYLTDAAGTLRVSTLIVISLSLVASYVYRLGPIQLGFLIVTSWLMCAVLWMTTLLRSQRHFVVATAIDRIPYALMMVGGFLAARSDNPLGAVLAVQVGLVILSGTAAALVVRRSVGRGSEVLGREHRRDGAALAVQSLSYMATASGDIAVAGLLVAPEVLAVYSVVLTLMSPFDLLRGSYQTLLLTEIGRRPALSPSRVLPLVIGPTVTLFLAYIVFGRFVLHGIYAGKYDAGESLVLILAAAFTLQALYNVFYCFNAVRCTTRDLRRFVMLEVGLAILGLGSMYVATSSWGLLGTSFSLASVWGARALGAWIFSRRQRPAPVETLKVL